MKKHWVAVWIIMTLGYLVLFQIGVEVFARLFFHSGSLHPERYWDYQRIWFYITAPSWIAGMAFLAARAGRDKPLHSSLVHVALVFAALQIIVQITTWDVVMGKWRGAYKEEFWEKWLNFITWDVYWTMMGFLIGLPLMIVAGFAGFSLFRHIFKRKSTMVCSQP